MNQTRAQFTEDEQTAIIEAVRKVLNSRFLKDVKTETEFLKRYGVEAFKKHGDAYLSVSSNQRTLRSSRFYNFNQKHDVIGYLFKPYNSAKNEPIEKGLTQIKECFKQDKKWIFYDADYCDKEVTELRERINRDLTRLEELTRTATKTRIKAVEEWNATKAEYIAQIRKEG